MTNRDIRKGGLDAEKFGLPVVVRCLCAIAVFLLSPMWPNMSPALAADLPTAARTVLDLQPFRHATRVDIEMAGGRKGTATLTELNPRANAWYLLELDWLEPGERRPQHRSYHLENPNPRGQENVRLDAGAGGLHLQLNGAGLDCPLWTRAPTTQLEEARKSALPYAPLCNGRIYLRNPVAGTYTRIERVTNFLRDHVWGGDRIVGFVRDQFYEDAFIERGETAIAAGATGDKGAPPDAPAAARLAQDFANRKLTPDHLGIDMGTRNLRLGHWYPARDAPGIYLSTIQPLAIDMTLLHSAQINVNALDSVEANANDYLVAFDLNRFSVGFALGTDHPRVGWSERTLDEVRDHSQPGPDGIDTVTPLVTNGMLSPTLITQIAATFTGGFKREHGAFHFGALAHVNHGSHYGFIEQGTVFSKLQPGLATLYVLDDGTVGMKTWDDKDNDTLLPQLRHARQNGVALIEYYPATGQSRPGTLVNRWGAGNWSGSDRKDLRTLRAGACLANGMGRQFLIYGYFSSATPSAMARVFQAYGCRYAMHLDMNALEHTYLAIYTHKNGKVIVEHLIQGMAEVDQKGGGGEYAPRFLNYPDDRDFFYVLPKNPPQ
ncbi:conserved protein of unknown function [Georgfuchsia toluolica]|uniref:Phosphodiester glycosidase domain-containing protein n=1 Tax=Georgfuchsia toluolica TaxID=424218 RepID=A0A916MZS2_9PROT|nr:hypothetical protein [Georgfuchsia toluolica]CAG4883208.1 conserved protein of unknown function [Georgfuchsia toluolica]